MTVDRLPARPSDPTRQQTEGGTRSEYLDQVTDLLFPGAGEADGREAFVAFPPGPNPLLLVPRRPRRAAASAWWNYKASATPGDRLKLRLLATVAGAGALDLLGSRRDLVVGADGEDSLLGHLRDVFGEQVRVAVLTSPPRANRKPVLQLFSARGHLLGFVKVATNPLTSELVRAETRALRALCSMSLRLIRPPALLHEGTWRGRPVLVQEALRGGPRQLGTGELGRAMQELAEHGGPAAGGALDGGFEATPAQPYGAGLAARIRALPPSEHSGPLAAQADAILTGRRHGDVTAGLPLGAWHGDWTPWNMAAADGRVLLWDWERFSTGVPVGFDAVHHRLQGDIVRRGRDPRAAATEVVDSAPELLAPFGLDAEQARTVAVLYLLEIGCRYEGDDQAGAGARLADLSGWLLPALERHA